MIKVNSIVLLNDWSVKIKKSSKVKDKSSPNLIKKKLLKKGKI